MLRATGGKRLTLDQASRRSEALAALAVLDSPHEQAFDDIVFIASQTCDAPIALISLLDTDRQWFKARVGFDPCETSREISFCTYAIMEDDILFVPDALEDIRFNRNPLVLGPPYIRFYAGKPLVTKTGERIGTVCLIGVEPRGVFTTEDRKNLTDLAALVMDRMEMRRLDFARTISQTRFENIAATSPDAIICSNERERITFWNKAAEKLFGYTAEEMSRLRSDVIIPDSWRKIYDAELQRLRNGERLELEDETIELSGLRKDGTEFPSEMSLSTWKEGNTASVGAIVRDITERKFNEERLFRLANIDALTDLPNRAAWRNCLEATLGASKLVTIMLFDLDRFKEVNDTLGHSAGDAVLREVAERLKSECPQAIMVARLGGDEFVALLPGVNSLSIRHIASALVDRISEPFIFAGERIDVGVSIGIAFAPQHGAGGEEVLGAADLALYKAKAAGKGRYELFTPSLRQVAVARREFEAELKQAFVQGQFELFYQPQIDTAMGRVMGAEALIRWNHPTRGLLSPVSFIDVLAEKPSAPEIGAWILRAACQQAKVWQAAAPGFRIGVNLFQAQFRDRQLTQVVSDILEETGLIPNCLELEIVENILLRYDDSTLQLLKDLRRLGVGLAFDDYGTGFASLSLLKRYPVTRLKIDRSFIRNVATDFGDAAVVNAIIYLGRSFGMEVIAEGVETQEQYQFLQQQDCVEVQGYLFGKPVRAAEFEAMFLNR
ncbi:MAG: EAL domain-containing protein [Alphaproteobacteria bacterium]|nr:MAG: EAL domain-containing protein [Alphaproteobacteria bacterium]